MTELRPAVADLALCGVSRHCTVGERCYRSPRTRKIAIGRAQAWVWANAQPNGACPEFRELPAQAADPEAGELATERPS